MDFGIHLPQAGKHASARAVLDVAKVAEDTGFGSAWLFDHIFTPQATGSVYPGSADGVYAFPLDAPYFDAVPMMAALAATTTRITFGTRVLVPVLRSAPALAKELATIDVLAGGRMYLGVGIGWMREEYEAAGVPFDRRGARLEDHIGLLRHAWTGELTPYDGPFQGHVAASFLPRPPRGTIPVLFGGFADGALERIARIGDGWAITLPSPGAGEDPAEFLLPKLRERLAFLRTACDRAGRDFAELTLLADGSFESSPALFDGYAELGVHLCDLVSLRRPEKLLDQITDFAQRHGTSW